MANGNALIPVKTYNLVDPETGQTVTQVPPGAIQQFNNSMQPNPGAGAWGTFGDALQIGANVIEAGDLRDLRDDIRDSRDRLHKRREALKTYLEDPATTSATIDPRKLSNLLGGVWQQQDDLDRSQTRALGTIQDSLWINVFGAGARVVGRMQQGGGMGGGFGGGDGIIGPLVAGGIGALVFGALDDDDWRGRRRRDR